ncbi:MAG: hypothetical protein R3F59_22080 [Myxococcota bacterium]
MARLPPPPDRAWLLDELRRLVGAGGDRQLVRARIRRPTVEEFPEPWSGDAGSLQRLLGRMLKYAGLGGVSVRLETRVEIVPQVPAQRGAWFAGLDGATLRFGCAVSGLEAGGAPRIAGLAHEVARGWRAVHGMPGEPGTIEPLAALTTVYLGFGLFTANLACSPPVTGVGGRDALPVDHLGFALAAQILARRTSCMDTWRLLRVLEPEARGAVRLGLRALRPAEAVRERLGLALLEDPPAIDLLLADDRPPVERG